MIVKEGKISYYQIIRAVGSSKRPGEGYERLLWGDLKTMFEHHVEDAVWRNLQENKVLVWKLVDSCRVHFVRFQNLHVFMLVEKRYPLTPATNTDMLNKKLQVDHWNEIYKYQVYGRIVGIKRLLDDLRVTAAKVCVTAAKHKLVLLVIFMKNMLSIQKLLLLVLKVNATGMKVTTAERLQLLEEFMLTEK
ncbi:hypothetical protein Tco_1296123 [Tanacetum coccineum]